MADDEYFLCECFIACELYGLEHYALEPRVEVMMTYYIYQYEYLGLYKELIPDCEIMERDIEKTKSMMKLRFEDLVCYEGTDK